MNDIDGISYQVFFAQLFIEFFTIIMALTESEAAFEQRCNELVADGSLKNSLKAKKLTTYRHLAFALGTPQTPPTDDKMAQFAEQIFGNSPPPSLLQLSLLRTLHFEATTLIVAALKEAATQDSSESSLRKLPPAERVSREKRQQIRLAGVSITGEMCPSHHLCDVANTIYESGVMQWVPPSKCSKRDVEVQSSVKAEGKQILQVEKNALVVAAAEHVKADTSTELKLQWAWNRRGIAFDQCSLLSWSVHQQWVSHLMEAMCEEPPPGYSRVTPAQAVQADRELWTMVARLGRHSYKVDSRGDSPLDKIVSDLMHNPKIGQCLLPLPKGMANVTNDDGENKLPSKTSKKVKKRNANKNKGGAASKPDELKDYACKTPQGKPICWAFNCKAGCKHEVSGTPPRCKAGIHACAKCYRTNHSLVSCRAKTDAGDKKE